MRCKVDGVTVNSERASPLEAGFFVCLFEAPLADAIATSGITVSALCRCWAQFSLFIRGRSFRRFDGDGNIDIGNIILTVTAHLSRRGSLG
jgi:hypothetical protein